MSGNRRITGGEPARWQHRRRHQLTKKEKASGSLRRSRYSHRASLARIGYAGSRGRGAVYRQRGATNDASSG
jgi:hypothetical protein